MRSLFEDFERISPDPKESWAKSNSSFLVMGIVGILIFIFIFAVAQSLYVAIGAFIIILFGGIQSARRGTVRTAICERHNWISGVCLNSVDAKLQANFKTLPVGSPSLTDEITGKLKDETFFMGRFSATTGSGKNRRTVTVNVLLFKLERYVPLSFSIVKEGFFASKDDIQVESIAFNEEFKIQYDTSQKQQVMQLLTPSLQTLLLDIHSIFKLRSVEVVDDVLLFSYDADLFSSYGLTTHVTEGQISKIEGKIDKLMSFADEVSDIFDK